MAATPKIRSEFSTSVLIGAFGSDITARAPIDVDVHSRDGFQSLKKLDFSREGVPCVATPSGGNH
jgi:hypothetical protein